MFKSYLGLGFEHILDPNGLDHVLFIIVLTVPYLIKDWKKVILLATAFTVGHSLTLALASLNIISVNSRMIEILIAVSICLTALNNLLPKQDNSMSRAYIMASFFGLIHGMGFSNFFRSIMGKDDIILPLFAFNIGVELAQIVIVLIVLIVNWILIEKLKHNHKYWTWGMSSVIIFWSIKMILERI